MPVVVAVATKTEKNTINIWENFPSSLCKGAPFYLYLVNQLDPDNLLYGPK